MILHYNPDNVELWGMGSAPETLARWGPGARDHLMNAYHPPLQPLLLLAWSALGKLFGAGGEIVWLRLPTLGLYVAFALLLIRIGRLLGSTSAGLAAATLATFLPNVALLSILQANYFMEAVAVTWFLERLVLHLRYRQPVLRSLTLSAVTALWVGNLALLTVGPGMLWAWLVLLRRRHWRGAAGVVLLGTALYAPLLPSVLVGARTLVRASHHGPAAASPPAKSPGADDGEFEPAQDMRSAFAAGAPYAIPEHMLNSLAGWTTTALPLYLGATLLLILWGQGAAVLFALLVLGLYTLTGAMIYLRWVNHSGSIPLYLLLPVLGAATLKPRFFGRSLAGLAPMAVAAVMLLGAFMFPYEPANGLPSQEFQKWSFYHYDLRRVVAPILAEAGPPKPLLFLGESKIDLIYALCTHRSTLDGCFAEEERLAMLPGLAIQRHGGRTVATLTEPYNAPAMVEACTSVKAALALPAWPKGPFWLVESDELHPFVARHAPSRRVLAALEGRCTRTVTTRHLTLWRCPEAPTL